MTTACPVVPPATWTGQHASTTAPPLTPPDTVSDVHAVATTTDWPDTPPLTATLPPLRTDSAAPPVTPPDTLTPPKHTTTADDCPLTPALSARLLPSSSTDDWPLTLHTLPGWPSDPNVPMLFPLNDAPHDEPLPLPLPLPLPDGEGACSVTEPTHGQGVHAPLPAAGAEVPTAHAAQVAADDAPVTLECVPDAHCTHVVAPTTDE
jgi:hypothetical protein